MEKQIEQAITDYKFFCFNGEPKIMYWSKDKAAEPHTDFFDMEYNHLSITMRDPMADEIPPKPENFNLMIDLAKKLSAGFPHLRVDFYEVNGKVFSGELTLYHCSGFIPVSPKAWEQKLGAWISLM